MILIGNQMAYSWNYSLISLLTIWLHILITGITYLWNGSIILRITDAEINTYKYVHVVLNWVSERIKIQNGGSMKSYDVRILFLVIHVTFLA